MNKKEKLGEKLKRFKGLGLIGIGDLAGGLISSIFWFYLATLIEPGEYGNIHYIMSIAAIASSIALIGTQESITVLSAKGIKIQSSFTLISFLISIASLPIIFLITEQIDVWVLSIFFVINTLAIGDLLGGKYFLQYSIYNIIQKILILVLGLGFYFIFGVEGIIFAIAFSYSIYLIKIIQILKDNPINLQQIKNKKNFILQNYSNLLIGTFGSQVDKIIIIPILGSTILGNYSLSLQVISILTIFTTILFKFLLPMESTGEQNKFLVKMVILSSIVTTIIGFIFSPILIDSVFPKYHDASESIQIMCLSIFPITLDTILMSRFIGNEKSKFILIENIIGVSVIIIGIMVLGNLFGILGLSVAFVLSSISRISYISIMYMKMERLNV